MNRLYKYIYILSCIVLVSGCLNVEEFEEPALKVARTFHAQMEEHPATKTVLGEKNAEGITPVLWMADDKIGVIPADGSHTSFDQFVNKNRELADTAIFEGVTSSAADYYSIYPYDKKAILQSDSIIFNLNSVQTYKAGSFDQGAFPMVARAAYDEGGNFDFKNLCGVLEINLTGLEKIKSITFSAERPVSGSFSVNMKYDTYPIIHSYTSSSKSITLKCDDGVQLNESNPTPFHFVLPPAEYEKFKLIILTTDGKMMVKQSKKPLNIKRSYIIEAGALAYVESTAFDLSEFATANCYLVPEYGVFVFDATVKGNSNESVGIPVEVEVLWETKNTTAAVSVGEIVSDVSLEDGKIYFTTNGTPGNALIAVKDASGTIIWSWHIWVSDYDPYETACTYMSGAVMMDRNLGALNNGYDPESYGFLYQWGRKDPLLGSADGSTTFAKTAPAVVKEKLVPSSPLEYSIANPIHVVDDLYNDNSSWSRTKTMYDPCPPGWRVPDGGTDGVWNGMIYGSPGIEGGQSKGYWVINPPYSTPATTYPAPGYTDGRSSLNLYFPGSALYCWSCDYISSSRAYGMHLFDRIERELSAAKDAEFSVRCMRETLDNLVLNTSPASEISETSAKISGSMHYLSKNASVLEMGFVWSGSTNSPDINCEKITMDIQEGDFSTSLTDLKAGTTYSVRTYANDAGQIVYGNVISFTTLMSGDTEKVPEDNYEWE